MPSDPETSVRELLERAVPREVVPAPLAAEIRAIGTRRRRRTQAAGAALAVAAVAAGTVVGVQVMGAPGPAPVPVGSATSSHSTSPSATEKRYAVRDLGGTTWVLPLSWMGVSAVEAWPGDAHPKGPTATFEFATDHSLTIRYVENAKPYTITGTWEAWTPDPSGLLDSAPRSFIKYHVQTAAVTLPESLQFLVARAQMVGYFGMQFEPHPARSYLNGRMLVSFAENVVNVFMYQVRPGTQVPGT